MWVMSCRSGDYLCTVKVTPFPVGPRLRTARFWSGARSSLLRHCSSSVRLQRHLPRADASGGMRTVDPRLSFSCAVVSASSDGARSLRQDCLAQAVKQMPDIDGAL